MCSNTGISMTPHPSDRCQHGWRMYFRLSARYPTTGHRAAGMRIRPDLFCRQHAACYPCIRLTARTIPPFRAHLQAVLQKLSALGGQSSSMKRPDCSMRMDLYRRQQSCPVWSMHQVRPDSRDDHRIDYTAHDRKACSAYWLSIGRMGTSGSSTV